MSKETKPQTQEVTAATPSALPQGLNTLMNATGRASVVESIEPDGSFPKYKLRCSDIQLRGKYSSNGVAVEMILSVTHINQNPLPKHKIFSVTDPTKHSSQVPARMPVATEGVYLIEATFGRINEAKSQGQLLDGDDGIRIINLSVPDGLPFTDMWSAERQVANNPALIESNRRKAGAQRYTNNKYAAQEQAPQFQSYTGFGQAAPTAQAQPGPIDLASTGF